jgi:hypothetical protein
MSLFSPLPGTPLYSELVETGRVDPAQSSDLHRLLVGDDKYRRTMTRGFYFYQFIHAILPDEVLGAFFHPDRIIRRLKFYGYVMAFRFIFYKFARCIKLCDI